MRDFLNQIIGRRKSHPKTGPHLRVAAHIKEIEEGKGEEGKGKKKERAEGREMKGRGGKEKKNVYCSCSY